MSALRAVGILTVATSVPGLRVVGAVLDGWRATVRLLADEVAPTGLLAQRGLEVLQLTQEVEVGGNGGPALLHKPLRGQTGCGSGNNDDSFYL